MSFDRPAGYYYTTRFKTLSAVMRAATDARCACCNSSDKLHAHHRTYKNWPEELLEDLTLLCAKCHKAVHSAHQLKIVPPPPTSLEDSFIKAYPEYK